MEKDPPVRDFWNLLVKDISASQFQNKNIRESCQSCQNSYHRCFQGCQSSGAIKNYYYNYYYSNKTYLNAIMD